MELKVNPNHSKKTFTIRKYCGRVMSKYRTLPMSKSEFEENLYNTQEDWKHILRTQQYQTLK